MHVLTSVTPNENTHLLEKNKNGYGTFKDSIIQQPFKKAVEKNDFCIKNIVIDQSINDYKLTCDDISRLKKMLASNSKIAHYFSNIKKDTLCAAILYQASRANAKEIKTTIGFIIVVEKNRQLLKYQHKRTDNQINKLYRIPLTQQTRFLKFCSQKASSLNTLLESQFTTKQNNEKLTVQQQFTNIICKYMKLLKNDYKLTDKQIEALSKIPLDKQKAFLANYSQTPQGLYHFFMHNIGYNKSLTNTGT